MERLKPTFGPVSGTLMMLNIVLGASLFILPGLAAQQTGIASILFWLLAIGLATPLLIAFWVLAGHQPSAGGVAVLIGKAFGQRFFLVASYLFLGAVMLGLPAVALTAGFALQAGFGWPADIAAMVIMTLAIGANFMQTSQAGKLGSIACSVSLILMIGILSVGFWLTPASGLLQSDAVFAALSDKKWLAGLSVIPLIFFAFTGWEVAISLGGEFKSPHRNLPIALAASFFIAAALYMACALMIVHAGPSTFNEAPFVHLLAPVLGARASQFIALFIALLIWANLFAATWSVSRMIYSISQQGYLPAMLGRLSGHIPKYALLAFAAVGLSMLGLHGLAVIEIDQMLTLASLNFLVLYGLVCAVGVGALPRLYQRVLSGFSIVTVVAILLMAASGLYLIYPLLITIFALVVFTACKKSDPS